ncbi:MAG: hypothetical protein JWP95_2299, partial [Actinotalea sp.]|nr:hypothetical protein [Actinotalea sp.]
AHAGGAHAAGAHTGPAHTAPAHTAPAHVAPSGPPPARPADRRRVPVWLLVLVPLLVVGAAVAFFLTRPEAPVDDVAQEAPEDVVVTLAPPTPTIEPVAREAGSALYDALPSTVLAYAMTAVVAHPPLVATGALEAYQATYSDGGDAVLVASTGQWSTAEEASAALDAVIAAETATGTPEQGPVTVDGTQVGRYLLVERGDGTGTVWWTNSTVLIQLDGPADALRDVFTAFPL